MRVKLNDAFDLQMGKTPSRNDMSFWNGTNKWVSIGDLGNSDKYIENTKECISDDAVQSSGIKVVPKNTVIMSFKLSIGKTAITKNEIYTNEAIMAFIDNGKYEIDVNYIYHLFSGKDWSDGTNKAVLGLTLNKATLSEIEIDIPSIERQKEVATNLDKLDDLIALRKQQLSKLDELVKSRFVELFDSIDNCKISKFSDECEEITAGGDRPKDTSEIRTEDYPYPVFANAATNEGLLCFSREYKIEKPCVTIAARGCTVGFTAIRYEKFTPVVRLISLVPKETITPIYLKYYIDIKMNIEGNGAAQPQLTIPMIKSMEIMVPPIELQNQFAAFVEQTDKSKLAIQKSLDELETLKKALMQEYFC